MKGHSRIVNSGRASPDTLAKASVRGRRSCSGPSASGPYVEVRPTQVVREEVVVPHSVELPPPSPSTQSSKASLPRQTRTPNLRPLLPTSQIEPSSSPRFVIHRSQDDRPQNAVGRYLECLGET